MTEFHAMLLFRARFTRSESEDHPFQNWPQGFICRGEKDDQRRQDQNNILADLRDSLHRDRPAPEDPK